MNQHTRRLGVALGAIALAATTTLATAQEKTFKIYGIGAKSGVVRIFGLNSEKPVLRKPIKWKLLDANCWVPCDHVPVRSWPLFRARQLMRDVIESFKPCLSGLLPMR